MGSPPEKYWDNLFKNFPPKTERAVKLKTKADREKDADTILFGVFAVLALLWLISLLP